MDRRTISESGALGQEQNQTATITFYGQELITVEQDGTIFVAMKPICEGMGLNWKSQYAKIRNSKRYGDIAIPVQTPGGIQEMLCIPLTKLNGWLFSINPMKVRIEIRPTVELYQEECFVALYDYWHKGVAINPRAAESVSEKLPLTIGFLRKETEEAILVAGIYGLQGNQALLSANMFVRSRYDIDCMARLGITHLDTDDMELHLTPSDIGKELGCSARTVNKLLISQGFQTSFRDAKKRILYEPTEKGMPYAVFKDTSKTHKDGTPIKQLFWKKSVIPLLKETKPKELGE